MARKRLSDSIDAFFSDAPIPASPAETQPAAGAPPTAPQEASESTQSPPAATGTDEPIRTSHGRSTRSTAKGCKPGEARMTIIAKEERYEQLRNIAYWERKTLKQVIDAAFEAYTVRFMQEQGWDVVKPRPEDAFI